MEFFTSLASKSKITVFAIPFFSLSFLFSIWVVSIPIVKDELHLTHSEVGVALFFISLGAVLSVIVNPYIINFFGEGRTCIVSLIFFCFCVNFPILSPNLPILCLSLFTIGFIMSIIDVSMNSISCLVEKESTEKMMSINHASYSLGGMIGGIISGYILSIFPNMVYSFALLSIIVLFVVVFNSKKIFVVKNLKNLSHRDNYPTKKKIDFLLIKLVMLAFFIMMGEGVIADWSAIYILNELELETLYSGVGYSLFSLSMLSGRVFGSTLYKKYDKVNIVRFGSLLSMIGTSFLIFPNQVLSLIGFSLIGFGYSNIVPIAIMGANKVKNSSLNNSISFIAGNGYLGFLFGPIIIGFFSELYGISNAFIVLLILSIIIFFLCKKTLK